MSLALPSVISLPLSFTLLCLNLIFCGSLVFIGGVLKFIIPLKSWHQLLYRPMHMAYRLWAKNNMIIISLFNRIDWVIEGDESLNRDTWYLLIANHQSWLDIFVLTSFAQNKIPEPKFFLKDSLKKVPFVGMACWALNMPFMKRYSADFLAKHPHLKGQDIATTKKSCQSFKEHPTTIINFVEGTRLTPQKHQAQLSPFTHLLLPKAGGIAFTLAALGEQFDKILNVTILYPDNNGAILKDMFQGKITRIIVHIEQLPVNEQVIGDYFNDTSYKESFQQWLNELWSKKDKLITELLTK